MLDTLPGAAASMQKERPRARVNAGPDARRKCDCGVPQALAIHPPV
jgi:hypothetical protein